MDVGVGGRQLHMPGSRRSQDLLAPAECFLDEQQRFRRLLLAVFLGRAVEDADDANDDEEGTNSEPSEEYSESTEN